MNGRMFGAAAALLSMAILVGLSGCSGGSGEDSSPDIGEGPFDEMTDLGQWELIVEDGQQVGIMHLVHGLSAQWDPAGENPRITASAPQHQPTVSGTWRGRWGGYIEGEPDDGSAVVRVTIQGSSVDATLTYTDIDGIGSITSERASVTDGRFAPRATVTVDGVPLTYSGEGQFGGTDQNGVVGYVGGPGVTSVFWGDRN